MCLLLAVAASLLSVLDGQVEDIARILGLRGEPHSEVEYSTDRGGQLPDLLRNARRIRAGTVFAMNPDMDLFRKLTENIRDVFWVVTPDLARVLYVSPAYARIWGEAPETLYDDPAAWLRFVHPDDREGLLREIREQREQEGVASTFRIRRRDGALRWIRGRSFPLRDESGSVTLLVGLSEDVTEARNAELRLEEDRERDRRFLDALAEGILGMDSEGRCTFCNAEALALFGCRTAAELVGRELGALTDPEGAFACAPCPLFEVCRAALAGGARLSKVTRPDGSTVPVEVRVQPLSGGGRTGSLISVLDISKRCEAQRSLSESQDQLRQAQKMEAIGQLAGGVAHDFNNLLTAILGYSDLLLMRLDPSAPHRAEISEIRAAGARAADLTRQLLAFSRKQVLQPRLVALDAIVEGMEKMLKRVIGEHIRLIANFRPCGRVKVDPGQMEQVVMNLAVNARDAMPEGGKLLIETSCMDLDVHAALRHALPAGRYAVLSVTDSGCGMTPEVRARLFEPFFTTKPQGKGTGLGLSTVHGIVRQSGGYVWVYTEPGKGSTFKVCLPLAAGEEAAAERPEAPSRSAEGSETLLLVEDEETVRTLTRKVLESLGYRVLSASRGDEGLRIVESFPEAIHLVVTDVVMPGMSGGEAASRMLRLRPALRVLYLSGYTDEAVVHLNLLEPGKSFLQKPYTPQALARKVREALDGTQSASQATMPVSRS